MSLPAAHLVRRSLAQQTASRSAANSSHLAFRAAFLRILRQVPAEAPPQGRLSRPFSSTANLRADAGASSSAADLHEVERPELTSVLAGAFRLPGRQGSSSDHLDLPSPWLQLPDTQHPAGPAIGSGSALVEPLELAVSEIHAASGALSQEQLSRAISAVRHLVLLADDKPPAEVRASAASLLQSLIEAACSAQVEEPLIDSAQDAPPILNAAQTKLAACAEILDAFSHLHLSPPTSSILLVTETLISHSGQVTRPAFEASVDVLCRLFAGDASRSAAHARQMFSLLCRGGRPLQAAQLLSEYSPSSTQLEPTELLAGTPQHLFARPRTRRGAAPQDARAVLSQSWPESILHDAATISALITSHARSGDLASAELWLSLHRAVLRARSAANTTDSTGSSAPAYLALLRGVAEHARKKAMADVPAWHAFRRAAAQRGFHGATAAKLYAVRSLRAQVELEAEADGGSTVVREESALLAFFATFESSKAGSREDVQAVAEDVLALLALGQRTQAEQKDVQELLRVYQVLFQVHHRLQCALDGNRLELADYHHFAQALSAAGHARLTSPSGVWKALNEACAFSAIDASSDASARAQLKSLLNDALRAMLRVGDVTTASHVLSAFETAALPIGLDTVRIVLHRSGSRRGLEHVQSLSVLAGGPQGLANSEAEHAEEYSGHGGRLTAAELQALLR